MRSSIGYCITFVALSILINSPIFSSQVYTYRWDLKHLYQYQVESHSNQWLDFSAIAELMKQESDSKSSVSSTGKQRYQFRFKATLEIIPLSQSREKRWLLAYCWRNVSVNLKIDDQEIPSDERKRFEREFEQTLVFVETDEQGKIERLWFSGVASEAPSRSILRAILARIQVVMPAQLQSKWESEEDSPEGTYLAVYEGTTTEGKNWIVCKRRVRYTAAENTIFPDAEFRPQGQVRIVWDTELGVLRGMEGEIITQHFAKGRIIGEDVSKLRVRYIGVRSVSSSERRALGASHRSVVQFAEGLRVSGKELSESERRALDRQLLGKENYESLMARLKRLSEDAGIEEASDLMNKWLALVRLEPSVCKRLEPYLRLLSWRTSQAQVLLFALREAGHSHAQTVLRNLAEAHFKKGDYESYGYYVSLLAFLDIPNEATEQYLLEKSRHKEKEVAYPARLALGSVGYSLREKQPERTKQILEWALEGLRRAEGVDEQELWLYVIGNIGHEGALSAVLPFVKHSEVVLRRAAVSALRFMQNGEAERALLEALEHDEERTVRVEAFSAYNYRPITERAVQVFERVLQKEPDKTFRREIIDKLWGVRERFPQVMLIVEKVSQSDPEEELRLYARSLLMNR